MLAEVSPSQTIPISAPSELVNIATSTGFIDQITEETLQASPQSIMDLAKNLTKVGLLMGGGFVDAKTVIQRSAMINRGSMLPRIENFAKQGLIPFHAKVVGEKFVSIGMGNGTVSIESIRFVDTEGAWKKYAHLGPSNVWTFDQPIPISDPEAFLEDKDKSVWDIYYKEENNQLYAHEKLPHSPIHECKGWEKIVWQKLDGPYSNTYYADEDWKITKAVWGSREFCHPISKVPYLEVIERATDRPKAIEMAVENLQTKLRGNKADIIDIRTRLALLTRGNAA
jgi:hypothetical protein